MNSRRFIDGVNAGAAMIVVGAACVLVGWGLSVAGLLSGHSYTVVTVVVVLIAAVLLPTVGRTIPYRPRLRLRRWRRGWPLAWLILAMLVMTGAALHEPSNIDALTYRLPRVLHWLDVGRWHWITSPHLRMNYSAVGTEWLVAPLLAWHVPLRLLAVPTLVAFLLMPAATFVALRGFGISGKSAWRWMWLVPTAAGFALQAGSLANDLLGAFYFFAALAFAARACQRRSSGWFVLAAVAIGLATNVKASNLVLVPIVAVMLAWAWRRLPSSRAATVVVALSLATAVSALPTLLLNARHTGHWSGDPTNATGVQPGSVAAALVGNTAELVLQNLAPPLFPPAGAWNVYNERVVLPAWREHFGADGFPRFTLRLGELLQEEWAGVGLFFCLLVVVEFVRARRETPLSPVLGWMIGAAIGGLVVFAATMGSEMPARLLLPLVIVPVAWTAAREPTASGPSRWLAGLAFGSACFAVIVNPARPLFPVTLTLRVAAAVAGERPVFGRAAEVYRVYAARSDMLQPIRDELRASDNTVGFLATDDDSEWSLWQPLGTRRVVHVTDPSAAKTMAVTVLVVRGDAFWRDAAEEDRALAAAGFRVVARHEIVIKASRPPERWLVARRG